MLPRLPEMFLSPPLDPDEDWAKTTRSRFLGTERHPDLAEIVLVLGPEPVGSSITHRPFLPGYNVYAVHTSNNRLIDDCRNGIVRGLSSERMAIRAALAQIAWNDAHGIRPR